MKIWDLHFNMWCKRCELAHGSEEKRIITHNGETVDDDLRSLYNSLPPQRLMNSSERNIFSVPLEKILALPVKKKLRYLRRKKCIRENYTIRHGLNRSRANMIQWLQPATRCPDTSDPHPNVTPTESTAISNATTPTQSEARGSTTRHPRQETRSNTTTIRRRRRNTTTHGEEKDISEYFTKSTTKTNTKPKSHDNRRPKD